MAEQDGNLWADYEASKAAVSDLAKLRKELDSVTQMDVSSEHNLDTAIHKLTVGFSGAQLNNFEQVFRTFTARTF